MKYGLQIVKKKKGDYQLGTSNSLNRRVLNPSGQWTNFLPIGELQRVGVESLACTTFALLNAVEILEREEFGEERNWSDRFLAYASNTTRNGNNPIKVAETLRKKGNVIENEWGNSLSLNSWNKYYEVPPQKLYTLAREFIKEYNFGYEWVNPNKADMIKALRYSPLTVAGWAWTQDKDGLFYTPKGKKAVHSFVVYGYEVGRHWKVFDSYDKTTKRLRWDYKFSMVQSYTLHNIRISIIGMIANVIKLLSTLLFNLKQKNNGNA